MGGRRRVDPSPSARLVNSKFVLRGSCGLRTAEARSSTLGEARESGGAPEILPPPPRSHHGFCSSSRESYRYLPSAAEKKGVADLTSACEVE